MQPIQVPALTTIVLMRSLEYKKITHQWVQHNDVAVTMDRQPTT